MKRTIPLLIAALLTARPASQALAQVKRAPDLASVPIEELMKIVVTTASRGPEGIASAPARVQVVSAAQIERRGTESPVRGH
jgi:outer membrane cobalamin receptor